MAWGWGWRWPGAVAVRWRLGWRGVGLVMVASNILWVAVVVSYGVQYSTVEIRVPAANDGRIADEPGLDEAVFSDAALRHWVVMAVVEVFTVGYHDVEYRRGQWRRYFTAAGYQDFVENRAAALRTVREDYEVVSATARGAPEIVERGVVEGRRLWQIRMPLRITVNRAGRMAEHEDGEATISVVRVGLSEQRPAGVALSGLRFREGAG